MRETDEIIEMLKKDGKDYFLKNNKQDEIQIGLYLEHLLDERGMSKNDLIRGLNIEESYGRKFFCGLRIPPRKILLKCAFLLSLDLNETQRLLDIGQKPRLYPRIRYDLAIIHGIENKMTLEEINAFLEEIGEETLL